MRRAAATLLPILLLAGACTPEGAWDAGEEGLLVGTQSIRNGTVEPTVVPLTDGQKLAIGWLHRPGDPGGNFCTGTLISKNVVATAEHCTTGQPPSSFAFGIGQYPTQPVATFNVVAVHEHPQVDAALLVLDRDATVAVSGLVPIAANRALLQESIVGTQVEAGGFGQTHDPNRTGLWFAALEFESIGQSYVQVNGNGQRGICFGDSGGPLLTTNAQGQPIVLAVESNGDESCLGRDNMTRLDVLTNWIDPVTGPLDEVDPGGNNNNNNNTEPNACDDIDYQGRCTGTVAEWCENGELRSRECMNEGMSCGFVNDTVGYFCIDETVTPEPECQQGDNYCDGSKRILCSGGNVVREECANLGMTCVFDGGGSPLCAAEPDPVGNNGAANPDGNNAFNPGGGTVVDPGAGWADESDLGWQDNGAANPGAKPPSDQHAFTGDGTVTSSCSVAPSRSNSAVILLALIGLAVLIRRR